MKTMMDLVEFYSEASSDYVAADYYVAGAEEVQRLQDRMVSARAKVVAALEQLEKDAESWRKYKARKDAAIAAGMGRSPLRETK